MVVRDIVPISIQEWNKKNDPEVSYVQDRQKDDLWTLLMTNFNLPPEADQNKVKAFALKKMAELFKNWKKDLNKKFVEKDKTPEFIGPYEKLKDHWPAFVAYKKSDKGKQRSATNKQNAAKKEYHHVTGSGGYSKARPTWDKAEQDLLAKGVQPATLHWPDRSRTWFFGVGGTLDPDTGKPVWTKEQLATPIKRLQEVIEAAQEGRFHPDKEKDELTEALGNAEHPGRTRGTSGSVPWLHGFPKSGGYRSRERKKKEEASEMQKLSARLAKLEELESQRATAQPSQRHEDPSFDTAPAEATPPSQRRSSVASTELVQPDFTAPRYPVDSITEAEHCVLMAKCQNLTLKAAVGFVLPPRAEGTFHCRPIPHGYAIVTVDEIMEGFEGLELDYPTGRAGHFSGRAGLGPGLRKPDAEKSRLEPGPARHQVAKNQARARQSPTWPDWPGPILRSFAVFASPSPARSVHLARL